MSRALEKQAKAVYHDGKNQLMSLRIQVEELEVAEAIKSKMLHKLNCIDDLINGLKHKNEISSEL